MYTTMISLSNQLEISSENMDIEQILIPAIRSRPPSIINFNIKSQISQVFRQRAPFFAGHATRGSMPWATCSTEQSSETAESHPIGITADATHSHGLLLFTRYPGIGLLNAISARQGLGSLNV